MDADTLSCSRAVSVTHHETLHLYWFKYTRSSLSHSQPIDWSEVEWQAHDYDQSHFNKDFKAFMGHPPTDFLRLHCEVYIDRPTLPPNFLPTG